MSFISHTVNLSEKETEMELGKINEHNALNYNGVVVLVNREISHAFAEKCNIVPDHRGVSLAFKTKYNKITFFHFVYAPTEYNAKKEFWQKFSDNLKSKHEHFIIGDLNVHICTDDSHSGDANAPEVFHNICDEHTLLDVWRLFFFWQWPQQAMPQK